MDEGALGENGGGVDRTRAVEVDWQTRKVVRRMSSWLEREKMASMATTSLRMLRAFRNPGEVASREQSNAHVRLEGT
jgi:hypothetical protein